MWDRVTPKGSNWPLIQCGSLSIQGHATELFNKMETLCFLERPSILFIHFAAWLLQYQHLANKPLFLNSKSMPKVLIYCTIIYSKERRTNVKRESWIEFIICMWLNEAHKIPTTNRLCISGVGVGRAHNTKKQDPAKITLNIKIKRKRGIWEQQFKKKLKLKRKSYLIS